jgi:hypothetical protein
MSGAVLRRADPDTEALRIEAESLRSLVRECASAGIARRALLLRLSQLPEDLARPHHLRLARSALDPLAFADRAHLFNLPNGDIAIVWRGEAAAALRASLDAVLHLFADEAERLPNPAALILAFRLPEQAEALLQAVEDLPPPGKDGGAGNGSSGAAASDPLDPQALAALEGALAQADVSRFVRRRQICERLPEGGFQLRWEKRALSVAEIAEALVPERAVRADPWLFRRLTRTLDRRMLSLLAAPQELRGVGPFGLNLNVASILSPEFLRFDGSLPATLRGQVVIDLLPADIMADPAAFLFARDFARDRGYRLLLRGVTADLMEVLPLRRIGLDLVRLRWSPELARLDPDQTLPDAGRTVLGRADTAEALAWGRDQGIRLYQGRAAVPAGTRAVLSG